MVDFDHPTCPCAFNLDNLRLDHEAGKVESFVVVAITTDGKISLFSHKAGGLRAITILKLGEAAILKDAEDKSRSFGAGVGITP
jgi:hypothetical protein